MKLAIVVLAAVALAGCAALGSRQADRYFALEANPSQLAPTPRAPPVAALQTTASGFYDKQDIAFSREPGTRGYYQFNHWVERPRHTIARNLAARFEPAGHHSGCTLATHLDEIYHDAASAPGSSRVTLTAQLLDGARVIVAQRTFTRAAPAHSYDAAGAVRGFDEALGLVLDDVAGWVDTEIASADRTADSARSCSAVRTAAR